MPLMFQPLQKYAVFTGRARRKEYWLFHLLTIILNLLLYGLVYLITSEAYTPDTIDFVLEGADIALNLVLLLPHLAVAVRRLHDSGRSGWWVLIIILNSVLFVILDEYRHYEPVGMEMLLVAASIVVFLLGVLWFLVLMCVRGTRGENRFGSDPLEPAVTDSGANVGPARF